MLIYFNNLYLDCALSPNPTPTPPKYPSHDLWKKKDWKSTDPCNWVFSLVKSIQITLKKNTHPPVIQYFPPKKYWESTQEVPKHPDFRGFCPFLRGFFPGTFSPGVWGGRPHRDFYLGFTPDVTLTWPWPDRPWPWRDPDPALIDPDPWPQHQTHTFSEVRNEIID